MLIASLTIGHPLLAVPQGLALVACVLAAAYHTEIAAQRVGQTFGTLLRAFTVTVIEVGLIVSLMLSGGEATAALARDTVFASIMIVLNGMVGICLLVAARQHGGQSFRAHGINLTLTVLAVISVIALVLPSTTISASGPRYSLSQLGFIATASLVLYGVFALVRGARHRKHFVPEGRSVQETVEHRSRPGAGATAISAVLLIVCLGAVLLLSRTIAPLIEIVVDRVYAPSAVVGVIVAAIVLLPQGFSALKAARANQLHVSLDLALGSAMASIGLTIPVLAALSIAAGWPVILGLDLTGTVLLALSLLAATLTLSTGRTIGLQGLVHLVIFGVYLFVTVIP